MNGFILRVTAYYGSPKLVSSVPVRPGISCDFPVSKDEVVHDLREDLSLDDTIDAFQKDHWCKVSYLSEEPAMKDGLPVFEFDVFEPAWPTQAVAESVVIDLRTRLFDWIRGISPVADTYNDEADDPRVPGIGA